MFDLAARRQLNRGDSDGRRGRFEIVLTPPVFGFLGRLVDGWLGTEPWCMIGFGVFAVSGMFVRFWLGYDREMQGPRGPHPQGHERGHGRSGSSVPGQKVTT